MSVRTWLWGIVVGLSLGAVVAISMTAADWRLNPSGLFHGPQGTNWYVVTETALSWFWPVALIGLVATVIVHAIVSRIRTH